MDRLARLATGGVTLRPQLMQALEALEKSRDHSQLSALFAREPGDTNELAYLKDALATSLDQLIDNAPGCPPPAVDHCGGQRSGYPRSAAGRLRARNSVENETARRIKQMLEVLPQLPRELQEKLSAVPPELRAGLDSLPPALARPDLAPLLRHLVAVGLVTEERTRPDNKNPSSPATTWSASGSATGCTTSRRIAPS